MKVGDKVRIKAMAGTWIIERIKEDRIYLKTIDDLFFHEYELEPHRPELDQMI